VLIDAEGRNGVENMATDEALLDDALRSGTASLRLYRWNPPTLSLGRNESDGLYDLAEIARLGIPVVRRPTGGKAVWHEHEVTYAAAGPVSLFGSLRIAYRAIHSWIAAALQSLGAEVALAPDRRVVGPLDAPTSCFATPVGGEVVVRGRKLVGSAQRRRGSAFLQHGSILLDGSQDVVRAVSRQASAGSETTLSAVLGRPVGFDEVAAAVVESFALASVASK
jgi:lipoate-protein ligase A